MGQSGGKGGGKGGGIGQTAGYTPGPFRRSINSSTVASLLRLKNERRRKEGLSVTDSRPGGGSWIGVWGGGLVDQSPPPPILPLPLLGVDVDTSCHVSII